MGRVGKLLRSLGKKEKGKADKSQNTEAKGPAKKAKQSHVKPGTFSTWTFSLIVRIFPSGWQCCTLAALKTKKERNNPDTVTLLSL